MTLTNILLLLVSCGMACVVWYVFFGAKKNTEEDMSEIKEEYWRIKSEVERKEREIGKLEQELENETKQKNELSGKGKQLFVEITSVKAELQNVIKEKENLTQDIARFRAEESKKEMEFKNKITQLDKAQSALENEQQRVKLESEKELREREERRDRIWAEHENNVKSQLMESCKIPEYNFSYFDNKNLPSDFGGKLKPDSMIEFLGQYVIFDAKVSKAGSLQTYIADNVKKTAEKIKDNPKIYPSVFFIVPNEAISSLNRTRYYEQGYDFFIIPPEAIALVLSMFKKINSYELAEQMDPRDRENIVSLIAEFDYHINFRNALDILAAKSGANVLSKAGSLKQDIKEEIVLKKNSMRMVQFSPAEIKTLMIDERVQDNQINELIAPKAQVSEENVSKVKPLFDK